MVLSRHRTELAYEMYTNECLFMSEISRTWQSNKIIIYDNPNKILNLPDTDL